MNIKDLVIENFLAIGTATMSLHEKGLVLLQGENRDDTSQDSNGAGKSTLPDALSWCFYGVTARGESGDDVVNRTSGKNCRITVKLDDSGTQWSISRHRKHKENKNRLIVHKLVGEEWEDKTLGTDKLTQEMVNKIIGCSKDVFCSAIYAGQENLVDLPSMTDKTLKVIVEEAAGIDKLQRGHKIANARALTAKRSHDHAISAVGKTKSGIELIEANIADAANLRDSWDKDAANRIVSASRELEEAEKALEGASEVDTSSDIKAIDEKLSKIDKAIDLGSKRSSEFAALEATLTSSVAQIRREKSHLEELKDQVSKAEKDLDIIIVSAAPKCDECGQEISDEKAKEAHISAHKQRIDKMKENVVSQEAIIVERGVKAREIKSKLISLKSNLTDTEKYKNARAKLLERKESLIASASKIENLKRILKEKEAKRIEVRDEVNPHLATINSLNKKVSTLKSELELNEKAVETSEYDMLVAEGAAKVFSPSGVRAHLLDQVTPFLNDRTSHYLSILSDGNITATWTTLAMDSKKELKEKFSIAVESETGGKSFRSLSGGEKRKVRLSTYLALQDLVSSRASKPINLLIADEIDQAVDKSGLERLMSVLTEKAKERGTAIVISHTDLKSWISNSVTIVKEDGRSRIEGLALS